MSLIIINALEAYRKEKRLHIWTVIQQGIQKEKDLNLTYNASEELVAKKYAELLMKLSDEINSITTEIQEASKKK